MIIIKQDAARQEVWRYSGELMHQGEKVSIVHAHFGREDLPFYGILFKRGDLFVEAFYHDKWYNILEIYDRDDGQLKGWYCNLSRPPRITGESITFQDLALDVLLVKDGEVQVLDEDEYLAQRLDPTEKRMVEAALQEVLQILAEPGFRVRVGSKGDGSCVCSSE
jgi:hypothetical protein